MTYYVYHHNFNKDEIQSIDVIRYLKNFLEDCRKKHPDRELFRERLRCELAYRFRSRTEWEVIISAWAGGKAREKIDVYSQVMQNFDIFEELCWQEVSKRWRKK